MNDSEASATVGLKMRVWRLARRHGPPPATLLAILAGAATLRLSGVSWGLPNSFQNPDETVVVGRALRVATEQLNPQWFLYPSFLFYLVAGLYHAIGLVYHPALATPFLSKSSYVVDPSLYVLSARLLVVAFGLASVYLVYRIGSESYSRAVGLLAALFLACEPLHVRYSHVAVTDVPATALALAALLFFLRAGRLRSSRHLVFGALLAGLATSTKYNMGMLLIPAAVACWFTLLDPARRRGPAAPARAFLVHVAAPMTATFLAGTPYALLDPRHFAGDFYRQNQIVASGWLGFEHVDNGYWYNLSVNLGGSLGVILLGLSLAGLGWAVYRRRRPDLILVPYVLAYFLLVSSWTELMDRYLLPIMPLLIVLAARLCVRVARGASVRRRVLALAVVALAAVAVAMPLTDSISYSTTLRGADSRALAKIWVERHLPAGSSIAAEVYGPPLVPRRELRYYRAAGVRPVAYRVLRLKLPLPYENDGRRNLGHLRRRGVRYVIVSSQVYDRVLAAREVYPREAAFYGRLELDARLLKVFDPGPGQRGPVIKVYRL